MRQAVAQLPQEPDIFLNDAVIIPGISEEKQIKIIKGRCKKCLDRGSQYPGKSDEGSYDDGVR